MQTYHGWRIRFSQSVELEQLCSRLAGAAESSQLDQVSLTLTTDQTHQSCARWILTDFPRTIQSKVST